MQRYPVSSVIVGRPLAAEVPAFLPFCMCGSLPPDQAGNNYYTGYGILSAGIVGELKEV